MDFVTVDGCRIACETAGDGPPVVFAHESAAVAEHWRAQVEALSGRYRCTIYSARGYPPSDVPREDGAYGYEPALRDLAAIVEAVADGGPAHIVGLSMGAYSGLMLALHRPELVRSLTFAGGGAGSFPAPDDTMAARMEELARVFLEEGPAAATDRIAAAPNRTGFRRRDPAGWQVWYDSLKDYGALGRALTYRNFQGRRPSLYSMEDALRRLDMPILLAVGDEDDSCLTVNLFLKETLPDAALWVVPRCGHAINLEYPADFNRTLETFLDRVEKERA